MNLFGSGKTCKNSTCPKSGEDSNDSYRYQHLYHREATRPHLAL
jgi:hypothetical protein